MKASAFIICLLAAGTSLPSSGLDAAERQGWLWGGGIGGAYLERTFSTTNWTDDATGRLYMEAFGGYAFNPHIMAGLEIGGWLITPDSDTYGWNPYWPPDNQPSEDPEGEALMQVLLFTRLYPYRDKGLFIKVGGGYLEHWWKTPEGFQENEEGWASVAGIGWDIHLSGNWSLTPTLSYSYGVAGNETHQAITASIGFMWHQWKGKDRFAVPDHEIKNGHTH